MHCQYFSILILRAKM